MVGARKAGHSQARVAIPKKSKRALEIGFVDFGRRMKAAIPMVEPTIAVKKKIHGQDVY